MQIPCPRGKYNVRRKQDAEDDCRVACPLPGQYNSYDEAGSDLADCWICDAGTYCPAAVDQPCPALDATAFGSYAYWRRFDKDDDRALSVAELYGQGGCATKFPIACPEDKYCPAGATEPLPCPAGRFNDPGRADHCAPLARETLEAPAR